MATILTKKKDTTGAPSAGDLTNSTGGAELAVNTADKRLYTKNSGGTVVEVGTNPGEAVTFVAGSASTPAITTTGDTNTGIFFPAADTIAFAEGGEERMRITSAGEVLVGGTTEIETARGCLMLERNIAPVVSFFRNDTIVGTGDSLGQLNFYGSDTTSNTPTRLAYISAAASGTHDPGDNPTDLVFGTTPNGSATVAEKMRLTEAGYLRLASGSGGIQFNGDTAAANALDDYEEGTFTPSWAFSTSGSVTYTNGVRNGKYTKIGNRVFFEIGLQTASISSPTGDATITGLPFTAGSTSPATNSISIGYIRRFATDMPNIKAYVNGGTTTISFITTATNATTALSLSGSNFSASTNYNTLYISGCYDV